MNKFNSKQSIEILHKLRSLLTVNHNVSLSELDKLNNIIQDSNYKNSNIDETFYSAYRRIQEIGINDEESDTLFEALFFTLKTI